ncbi:MAG: zf-TFIIB domain-containing protein [Sedimentisphaerales bacterium]|nr:zf-TFIIB domain-containing protein [Sedimentisphaerales bacterium]
MSLYTLAIAMIAAKETQERQRERIRRMIHARLHRTEPASKLAAEEQAVLDRIDAQLTEGNRVLSEKNCPECGRRAVVVMVDDVLVDCCPSCQGIWFDPGELKTLMHTDKDIPSDDLKHRESRHTCPVCRTRMTEYVYLRPHNLLVDRCPKGHGVYLEAKEIQRALALT